MKKKSELAEKLCISEKTLNYYAFIAGDSDKYYSFEISKRNGDKRIIHAPILPLKRIQRAIADLLKDVYERYAPKAVYGFRPERGHIHNAEVHLDKRVVIKFDLKDYFLSLSGGMIVNTLVQHPYKFSKETARAIAGICTVNGVLPQGSPASPILANIITRTLDIKLITFAHKTRGTYTRYADDITFSYSHINNSHLCVIEENGENKISPDILEIVSSKGFVINPSKTRIKKYTSRQIVTGIITNNKTLNLPREYIKETKLLINIALKYGKSSAEDAYFRKHPRNRYGYRNKFDIINTIRGRLEYIKSVKGSSDDVYIGLANRYKRLNPKYDVVDLRKRSQNSNEMIIFCEGKTDYKHLAAALSYFQNKGYFQSLSVDLSDKNVDGCDKLKKKFENMKGSKLSNRHIAIFDADVPDILKDFPIGTCTQLSENLIVMTIPPPDHIDPNEPFCIEMLYKDNDLKLKDSNGRRIYFASEFNPENGRHKTERIYTAPLGKSKKLIIDGDVFSLDSDPSINSTFNLSKDRFADMVSDRKEKMDFSGFSKIFDILYQIQQGQMP